MKHLITILLCLFTLFAKAQVNTNDTNKYFKSYDYGFSYKRLQAREAFIMPTDTVINKLGAVSLNGAIYLGNGVKWTSIGGGSSIDTTSLSNRINQRIDSLRRRNDSVFARKNGVFVFQYKDSVGTIPTLQQVTTAGSTSTNGITIPLLSFYTNGDYLNATKSSNGSFVLSNTSNPEMFKVNDGVNGFLKFGGGAGQYVEIATSPGGNVSLQVPQTSGTIPLSVNGNTADVNGNITIPSIDTTNQFVKRITRTPGKDSIIYFVGANRFAIKDSVGTNPAPVGYYGAFYDTTLQSAAVINTAYGVKLGITDLTNGVTVENNSKIKFANAGIYNIQFSLQLEKTGGSGNMIADIWLRKNNVNLVGTNGKIVLTGSANASPVVAAWNYVVAVSSNDSLELMWAVDNLNVKIITASAASPHPSTASAILTVTQQSGIMAGTGISPLDTANMLSPYARINLVNTKLNISDTSTMLSSYSTRINGKLNIADTSVMLAPYSRTNVVNASIATKVNISDTATMLTPYAKSNLVATKLNATDTASLSNRINQKPTDLDLLQSLGLGIKAEPYGCTYASVTSQLSLTSPRLYFYPFNWNVSDSIRGIAFLSRAATALTATNYNGVAIYSLSGGTLTRLTYTSNSATFWDNATINSWKNVAITPYYLPKGTYFLGYEASGSAGTPTIASGSIMQAGFIEPPTAINTNGIKISSYISNATTTPPSSVAMSTTTIVHQVPYFILY